MIGAHPIHACNNVGRVARSPTVQDPDPHDGRSLRNAVLRANGRSCHVGTVALAIIRCEIIINGVVSTRHAAGEVFVRCPDSSVDDVDNDSTAITVAQIRCTQRQTPLIHSVESPGRIGLLLTREDPHRRIALDSDDARVVS